ncbi:protein RD3-like [Erpetoichthys calabaricus]|uniref:Zgc:162144 n=1 Tax=Erpetoichthys calabaricus TaxID=27687 RepID=A0A8C4S151_ERPCA|nr:protein RD3-like [Erpetoichthys calabaricus]
MFPWSLFTSLGSQPLPSPRSTEELVSETLMLEFESLLKRCEKLQYERVMEGRRRRSSVDYSWLASPPRVTFQLSPGELLELQDLCVKILPSQCGPVILRFRKLVTEYEPDVHEVSRIFRSVLCDTLDEEPQQKQDFKPPPHHWDKRRTKSLSLMSFKSRLRINPFRNTATCANEEEEQWPNDEEMGMAVARRVQSMPEISPLEKGAQRVEN